MWDTKSSFTAQTSAWSGMATLSGTGFLSKVGTITFGDTGGFSQNDTSLRTWQSLYHLGPEGPTTSFPPSPGPELRAARGPGRFRQAEVELWLQDDHARLDTQLGRLMARNSQLSNKITSAQLLDMKHMQLSDVMSALEQEREAPELSPFKKRQQHRELHGKGPTAAEGPAALDGESNEQPNKRTPGSLGRMLPMSQEEFNRPAGQNIDIVLFQLREALRDAEARAKKQEEERDQALQRLHASTETQRALLNQIEEMNQRFNHTRQNQSEVQEQLSEANNKISQACLEKAMLSTQVLKLEDDMKDLKAKLTGPDKDHQIQKNADEHLGAQDLVMKREQHCSEGGLRGSHSNNQDLENVLTKQQSKAVREAKEKLTCELEMITQKLNTSQSQLREITAAWIINSKQITDLEAQRPQLISEKEELRKMNEGQHRELMGMREHCHQLRRSMEVLEFEKQKLQDRCLCLGREVLEKEEMLHLQREELKRQDAARAQSTEELKAVARHWTDKWQKVALTLQSTQQELEELKKSNSRSKLQTEGVPLASETERLNKEGQKDTKENEKLPQHKAEMEKALTSAKNESDPLLKVEPDACNKELDLERSNTQALLHKYKRKGDEASVQTQDKHTDLSQSSLSRDSLPGSYSSHNKPDQVCMQSGETETLKQNLTEREREVVQKEDALKSLENPREITEPQLKISALQLKDRKGKEVGRIDNRSTKAQTGASSLQDWTPMCKDMKCVVDRRNWQWGSNLMPVFEEDEENIDWPGGEEGKPGVAAHAERNVYNQNQQQTKALPLYPDGLFLAELVDICSPDETEEEGGDK